MENSTLSDGAGNKSLVGSIAFFATGSVFFLVTFVFWIVTYCNARRRWRRGKDRPLPLTPPTVTMEVMESGDYRGFQGSIHNYDSVKIVPGKTSPVIPRYIPRDAMHETFDGSRMPSIQAPKPPNIPSQIITTERKGSDIVGSTNQVYQKQAMYEENDSKSINAGCNDTDTTDEVGVYIEFSNEMPESSNPITERAPTIPARRPMKEC